MFKKFLRIPDVEIVQCGQNIPSFQEASIPVAASTQRPLILRTSAVPPSGER